METIPCGEHGSEPAEPMSRVEHSWSRVAATAGLVVVALLSGRPTPVRAQAACHFTQGFATLRTLVGAATIGPCLEDEHFDPAQGTTEQRTTRGLLVWRQADNWTAFTDGFRTWVRGPNGLQRRLNTERFPWEADDRRPVPPAPASSPPRPGQVVQVAATATHPGYVLYAAAPPAAGQRVAAGAAAPGASSAPAAPAAGGSTVLVLPGIDGDGPGMATTVLPWAQAHGETLVAPTLPYGNWRDPGVVRDEDLHLPGDLTALLDAVEGETGVRLAQPVVVLGFSRGAQLATRLALFFPERVRAVAAFAAGTYTLPATSVSTPTGQTVSAPFPFGTADVPPRAGRLGATIDLAGLTHVPFLLGVGANDNRADDVPRPWDVYVGPTRVERAQRFAAALAQIGCPVQVTILPATGHELTGAMLDQAFAFFTQTTPPAAA